MRYLPSRRAERNWPSKSCYKYNSFSCKTLHLLAQFYDGFIALGDLRMQTSASIQTISDKPTDLLSINLNKGRPAPAVTWKRRRKVIDDSYLTLNDLVALKRSGQLLSDWSNGTFSTNSNLINTDPSLGSLDSLHSLWREWRSWPEFEFQAAQVEQPQADESLQLEVQQQPAKERDSQTSNWPHLLTMQVHDSITTAVNVLRLSELNVRSNVLTLTNSSEQLDQMQLECEASNLHYDLRALIKLFAPPSLQRHGAQTMQLNADAAAYPSSQVGQLAGASAQALEWTLRGSDLSPSLATNGDSNGADQAATALRQINTEANWNQTSQFEAREEQRQANVIYQQLTRSHQLSSAAPQRPSMDSQVNPLVRSRLIALDVYRKLRPFSPFFAARTRLTFNWHQQVAC